MKLWTFFVTQVSQSSLNIRGSSRGIKGYVEQRELCYFVLINLFSNQHFMQVIAGGKEYKEATVNP